VKSKDKDFVVYCRECRDNGFAEKDWCFLLGPCYKVLRGEAPQFVFRCFHCRQEVIIEREKITWSILSGRWYDVWFCPNCGARIDWLRSKQ
jgi:hypothetical protein